MVLNVNVQKRDRHNNNYYHYNYISLKHLAIGPIKVLAIQCSIKLMILQLTDDVYSEGDDIDTSKCYCTDGTQNIMNDEAEQFISSGIEEQGI